MGPPLAAAASLLMPLHIVLLRADRETANALPLLAARGQHDDRQSAGAVAGAQPPTTVGVDLEAAANALHLR